MSRQEEIQEGIQREIEDTLRVCEQNPITARALAMDTSLDIVKYLHSHGCVFKKECELPSPFNKNEDVISALEYKKKLAGYTLTDPILEDNGKET